MIVLGKAHLCRVLREYAAYLFAEALHGKPLAQLSKSQRSNLFRKFEHDLSDHMPIWVRLPKP